MYRSDGRTDWESVACDVVVVEVVVVIARATHTGTNSLFPHMMTAATAAGGLAGIQVTGE